MGEIQLPADALYGASTQRAVENFPVSGIELPEELITALAAIKASCAETNAELGKLDASIASRISDAAEQIAAHEHDDQFPVDVFQTGSGTSTNMNINEVIATLAGEDIHPNDHVNMGQSSNDVFPSAIHIAAAHLIQRDLLPNLQSLWEELTRKAEKFSDCIKTGRTHLQDATPVTLGQEFSGYARQIALAIKRIEGVIPELLELPIGGTAVGTGINTHPQFALKVCEKLNGRYNLQFTEASNHFEAQAAKDACVQTSGTLKTLAVSLSKIANDIRWMGSGPRAGFGEIELPAVQPGSSIMPGKVNPVMCESVLQVCAQVIGNDTAITHAVMMSNFELNTGMPLIAHNLIQSIKILSRSIILFSDKCVKGIVANKERMEAQVEQGLMLATKLAPLVGYDRAAEIAKHAHMEGRTIREVALSQGVAEADLDKLLDPKSMLGPSE